MSDIVRVALDERGYDIHIGAGLLARAGELIAPLAPKARAFIVTDENVAERHLAALSAGLDAAAIETHAIVLEPGEEQKSFAGLESVCRQLIRAGADRRDIIVAFGGGVIGDLAGFAAGVVKRGVDFVQIPTTLLAQVDSSVGGKTAIDTPEGKNLVGLFHQPRLVLADLDVLATLPPRELRAGYAEVVKYGLIDDPDFFYWCEEHADAILAGADHDTLAYAVRHCASAKARIVAADERESGARALLNLGHTFGHALEMMAGFDGSLLHGEAVGTGMSLAYEFSARQELCPRQDSERVRAHLARAGFETDIRKLPGAPHDADRLMAAMAHDKKNERGALTLILARGIGRAFILKDANAEALRAFLQDLA